MRSSRIILSSLILFISMPVLQSQVTIGSLAEPIKGALLDLKTQNADGENVTVQAEKGGGLVLPRVQLQNKNTLEPFISTGSSDWNAGTNRNNAMRLHVGMMVYNLKTDSYFSPGIYTWNGSLWVPYMVNADNGLTKTDNSTIQLGGQLKQTTTIDQVTNNVSFTGTTGKMYMPVVANNIAGSSTENISTMGVNNTTGEVVSMRAQSTSSAKAINFITYQITAYGDWVENFYTHVNPDYYTLVVVGSYFQTATATAAIKAYTGVEGTTFPVNVYADTNSYYASGSTIAKRATTPKQWVIHADYVNGRPTDTSTGNGAWTIYCLVINNALVNILPTIENNEQGKFGTERSVNGDASVPAGLEPGVSGHGHVAY